MVVVVEEEEDSCVKEVALLDLSVLVGLAFNGFESESIVVFDLECDFDEEVLVIVDVILWCFKLDDNSSNAIYKIKKKK